MKFLFIIYVVMFTTLSFQVNATETITESAQDLGNAARREANQKVNQLKEVTCMESEAECLKEKAENRTQEATDAVKDKYNEIKALLIKYRKQVLFILHFNELKVNNYIDLTMPK